MIAAPLAPVQLCLELRARPSRQQRSSQASRRPFWDQVDLADVGGELRARGPHTRVSIGATQRADSTWSALYDLMLQQDGVSGATKPQATRQDALVSAAYGVAGFCRSILERKAGRTSREVRSAAEVMRWLQLLDLL